MRLVIIGNGMAATRLIASLTGRVPGRFAITVIGDEPEQAHPAFASAGWRKAGGAHLSAR